MNGKKIRQNVNRAFQFDDISKTMVGDVHLSQMELAQESEDKCWVCEAWIETLISVDLNAL